MQKSIYAMNIMLLIVASFLLGVDSKTDDSILLYLDPAYKKANKNVVMRNRRELQETILNRTIKRIRPRFNPVATTFPGLIPMMLSWAPVRMS